MKLKVCIVHDYLNQSGGAEMVLREFLELFPDAPVYTLLYNPLRAPEFIKDRKIFTSFVQKIPFSKKLFRHYFFLYPMAIENFDLRKYDLVISSSSGFAHGIIPPISGIHIAYRYNPLRYAWNFYFEFLRSQNFFSKPFLSLLLHYVRMWDISVSPRADAVLTISEETKKRIKKYLGIESSVIYPPVDTEFYSISKETERDSFYLFVGRLRPYKRIDVAIKSFNEIKKTLFIVGEGEEKKKLQKISKENIRFLGRVNREELRTLYRKCKALIFPAEEDFGITPLEAQACGTPVIAYKKGGALETVKEGQTGILFYPQTHEALIESIHKFEKEKFEAKNIRENACLFSREIFKEKFKKFLKKYGIEL